MPNIEQDPGNHPGHNSYQEQLGLDVPSLESALHSPPETRVDWHLGPGVIFRLGTDHSGSLELFSQVVRVRLPRGGELAIPRREPRVAPEGIVFEDPEHFFLSVGPLGDVLFQYSPPSSALDNVGARRPETAAQTPPSFPAPSPEERPALPSPAPVPEAKEKAKSEKYVGRLGEVKTHKTRQGKLVAEVEIAISDPDRPGSSKLLKFAAFGEKAEALQHNYQAGQLVTAVGIPHDIHRESDGRKWMERQWYFVQLPKLR